MNTTSVSLLERLRQPADQVAWTRFVHLYSPLLYSWARRTGLQESDAADLIQDVFAVLVQKLPEFRYDPAKSFRSWLRTVVLNKWRDRCRQRRTQPIQAGEAILGELPGPAPDGMWDEAEYRQQVLGRALDLLQPEFQPSTWQAFREHGLAGRPAAAVAGELGLSVGAVYAAKFRVLSRLRQELAGLLD
jgi:RNA polymerase sigma-70 factor (ECF subfamily)